MTSLKEEITAVQQKLYEMRGMYYDELDRTKQLTNRVAFLEGLIAGQEEIMADARKLRKALTEVYAYLKILPSTAERDSLLVLLEETITP
jgi:hypothetical protein